MLDFDRFGRITASVVPAILRLDENHSRKWAWRVITGREPINENPWFDIQRGLDHEKDAIEALEIDLGILAEAGRFVPHGLYDWLGASPDGFIIEGGFRIPVEAKCPRKLHHEVPPKYFAQVQTQLECCDAPYAYFISWVEDNQRVHKVQRSKTWWDANFPELESFYNTYVVPDVEPPKSPRRKKCQDAE